MHPCLSCGACCAHTLVQFHDEHVNDGIVGLCVPAVIKDHVVLRGSPGRCEALRGVIGAEAACGVYADRPPPCRELVPSMEDGTRSLWCDAAREQHGLPLLTLADWAFASHPS